MKIYKNLFNKMVSTENIFKAWDEFKKGKREKLDVQIFEFHLEDNLFKLQQDLANKTYKHSEYTSFNIQDPKLRHIHKAIVKDRIVHHLLFNCLNSVFERTFISDSYSCRKKKGTHKAIERLKIFSRKIEQTHGSCFVLKCDIKKFFASVDHKILFDIITKKVKDLNILRLVKEVIDSFKSEFSTNKNSKGAPIGNLTSQLFANIYLNELDQFIKQKLKVKYYIRYTDDFVVLHQDKDYILKIKTKIENFLKKKLKLSLHPDKVSIRKYGQGIDFLGYVTLPKVRVLRTKTKKRIIRKLKQRVKQFKNNEIKEETLLQSINSYLGVLSHADTHELKQKLFHQIWEWVKEP